ncbi:MAG: hypothetical protein IJ370_04695 [Oscillospiraceae bacterium]|nr:hypothetical protein [Oscillospiraceae bacterium]
MNNNLKMPSYPNYYANLTKGALRAIIRKIVGRDKFSLNTYNGTPILKLEEANDHMRSCLERDKPFMAGRFGDGELRSIVCYLNRKTGLSKSYPEYVRLAISRNAGLFPKTEDTIDKFAELMLESCESADILAVWFNLMEDYIYNQFGPEKQTCIYLKSLEPFWFDNPWSYALKGKKVLVVHPFEDTIKQQYEKRDKLFSNPKVLPEFELLTLKAVQSIGGGADHYASWFDALDWMYNQAMTMNFDVALIGCGAYGFPLAAKLKASGKTAIHMGGVTQMLFGIMGARWDKRPDYAALYNEHWCRPNEFEKPKMASAVEGGCYW